MTQNFTWNYPVVLKRAYMREIHCTIPADLVTFTGEILNGKLHFLCSDSQKMYICVAKKGCVS